LRVAHLLIPALWLPQPIVAQEGQTPTDTTAADSMRPGGHHHPLFLPALVGAGVVMAVAPPTLFLFPGLVTSDSTRTLADRYVALYLTGGGIGDDAPSSWTNAEHLDMLRGHLYAAASVEHFHFRERLRYYTIRAGYLFRPMSGFAGGLTVGYRSVSGGGGQDAATLSLPFMSGWQEVGIRFEPTYVISRAGVSWTYRFQGEFYGLPDPLFAGFVVDAKPLRQDGPYLATLALLMGVRR
jgi:hypothetical protein